MALLCWSFAVILFSIQDVSCDTVAGSEDAISEGFGSNVSGPDQWEHFKALEAKNPELAWEKLKLWFRNNGNIQHEKVPWGEFRGFKDALVSEALEGPTEEEEKVMIEEAWREFEKVREVVEEMEEEEKEEVVWGKFKEFYTHVKEGGVAGEGNVIREGEGGQKGEESEEEGWVTEDEVDDKSLERDEEEVKPTEENDLEAHVVSGHGDMSENDNDEKLSVDKQEGEIGEEPSSDGESSSIIEPEEGSVDEEKNLEHEEIAKNDGFLDENKSSEEASKDGDDEMEEEEGIVQSQEVDDEHGEKETKEPQKDENGNETFEKIEADTEEGQDQIQTGPLDVDNGNYVQDDGVTEPDDQSDDKMRNEDELLDGEEQETCDSVNCTGVDDDEIVKTDDVDVDSNDGLGNCNDELDVQAILKSASEKDKMYTEQLEAVRLLSEQISQKLETLELENSVLKSKISVLESGLAEKIEDLSIKITAIKEQLKEEAETVPDTQGQTSSNTVEVQTLIDHSLKLYDADNVGMPDYALESSGAVVFTIGDTEPYTKDTPWMGVFGISIWRSCKTPRLAIQKDNSPGNCWSFSGDKGTLTIQLSAQVFPEYFTIDHIPLELAPHGNATSAPHHFRVLGLDYGNAPKGHVLGIYEFTDFPLQTFPVQQNPYEKYFRFIKVEILSNHGNKDYTCLYRFRVHGVPFDTDTYNG